MLLAYEGIKFAKTAAQVFPKSTTGCRSNIILELGATLDAILSPQCALSLVQNYDYLYLLETYVKAIEQLTRGYSQSLFPNLPTKWQPQNYPPTRASRHV